MMKDSYVKPAMEIEVIDVTLLACQGGSSIDGGVSGPVAQNQPNFGICCP